MELTENKKEKGIWKLPKNVRQIGEPGSSTRILIEDYAYTYLHQMAEQNLTCMKTAVLLGNAEDGAVAGCICGGAAVVFGTGGCGVVSVQSWIPGTADRGTAYTS